MQFIGTTKFLNKIVMTCNIRCHVGNSLKIFFRHSKALTRNAELYFFLEKRLEINYYAELSAGVANR